MRTIPTPLACALIPVFVFFVLFLSAVAALFGASVFGDDSNNQGESKS